MWKNFVDRCRPQVALRDMRSACWIPNATHTHALTICNTHRFTHHHHNGCTDAPQCSLHTNSTLAVFLFLSEVACNLSRTMTLCALAHSLLHCADRLTTRVPQVTGSLFCALHLRTQICVAVADPVRTNVLFPAAGLTNTQRWCGDILYIYQYVRLSCLLNVMICEHCCGGFVYIALTDCSIFIRWLFLL